MATMPAPEPHGQPRPIPTDWFATAPGRVLVASESAVVEALLAESRALPWLWLAPFAIDLSGDDEPAPAAATPGRGLMLAPRGDGGWQGAIACGMPLPLPSNTFGAVVLQHVATRDAPGQALLAECTRLLAPGGRLGLLALNPLSPYRWRWRGSGLGAAEPISWRRRLREAGLHPDSVSRGIGPGWAPRVVAGSQDGPGLRATYLLRAEKRSHPLTPVRGAAPLRIGAGAATG